jgi:drug/metabolite transporter (DMT)-like permease
VGAAALTVFVAIRRVRIPRGRTLALVIAYGVLWFAGYTIALNAAERVLDAGTAALVVGIGPIIIAVLAGVYLREGFPRGLVAGLVIAFAGLAVIGLSERGGQASTLGVLLALTSAALWGVGVLLQKQALAGTEPLPATWLGCLAGLAACLPFTAGFVRELAAAPAAATAGIVYMGVFPTAIAFLTWSYALAHTTAGRLAVSTYIVPALAVLLSWLLLDEAPLPLALAGGALCLIGVAVSRLPSGASRKPPQPAKSLPRQTRSHRHKRQLIMRCSPSSAPTAEVHMARACVLSPSVSTHMPLQPRSLACWASASVSPRPMPRRRKASSTPSS